MKSFDRLARLYAPLEWLTFGTVLERARFRHIEALNGARRVLLLGEGDGRFLSRLSSLSPETHIDVVEKSQKMLESSRKRLNGAVPVRFFQTDALSFEPEAPYDAVVTCFFLDCFEGDDLVALIARLAGCLRNGGLWLYSDFQHRHGFASWHNRLWIASLYAAFDALTDIGARRLVDPRPLFEARGLRRVERETFRFELLTSELWKKTD